ncbi:glutamate synthase domain-containing protein 1 [Bradyrhizobium sp. USDA 4369]
MSGSKVEHGKLGGAVLAADSHEKPAEITHELHTWRPDAEGLYDPSQEKDSCGVGFIANIKGQKSHQIVADALSILCNLEHRGAVGADPRFGDGAGILVQIPHAFFARKANELGFTLPAPGEYAIGALFMPRDEAWRNVIKSIIADQIEEEGLVLLGWRDVPTDNSSLGVTVKPTEPRSMQVFIGRNGAAKTEDEFERKLYILRKSISQAIYQRRDRGMSGYYPCSMSCRTVIYKGMFLADQLGKYYADLHEPDFESALALVHQRFSTNTFPTWSLAHPYRMIAHNGEINTLRGNVNWMAARQASVSSELFGKDISRLWPISYEGQSDTACFDNALEFLVQGGYSLPHAVMMMIPEAWAGNPLMSEERRSFYEYHAALMEPWDGPAAIAFTDGRQIGATLDRNGLRPARYLVTKDDRIVMASEMGVLKIPEDQIVTKWRLQPGKMLLVDLVEGRLIPDDEIKAQLAASHPYQEWLTRTQIQVEKLPDAPTTGARTNLPLLDRQQAFGYTAEDINILMTPMAATGEEATGSMGNDAPISALSDKPKLLFTYFKQNFAQVTNPPIDPIREELVMSLVSIIGPRPNLFDLEGVASTKRLEVHQPILTDADLEKIRSISEVSDSHFVSRTLDTTFDASLGAAGFEQVLDDLCGRAEAAVREGVNIIILSDRMVSGDRIPIPSLLACAAVHHHLIRTGLRTSVGLVVESGEPREVHHFACLAGYGAEAINPYLAFETIIALKDKLPGALSDYEVVKRYIKSIGKGLLKVMSKMGISTYQSYCGAQIFDAVGLKAEFVQKFFYGTHTRIEGVGLAEIAEETTRRHRDAFGDALVYKTALDVGGEYAYRTRGEDHAWTAESVATLQHAVRGNSKERYQAFARLLNEQSERLLTPARPVPDQVGRGRQAQARPARRGRAGEGHRQAFRHGCDVVRLDLARGAHHARDRYEPDRRQVEHRRRRRGSRPLQAAAQRRFHALGDQAGRLGPVRRDDGIPRQLRHDADQDGAGREARRRRSAARPQGRRHHRQGAPLDPGRRPDLAAAASRHLLDRGSRAADLRPEERQSRRSGLGEARVRSRRRHRCGRRRQGARRPCDDRGLRGRHRRLSPHLDQACGLAMGDRPCRDASDPGARAAAQPHRCPGRRRLPHRP